jgi:hypothetical protein
MLNSAAGVTFPSAITHQDNALWACIWMQGEQERDVRQRSDRDERHRAVRAADLFCEEVDGVLRKRLLLRRREIGAVETRLAVDVRGNELFADKWPIRARSHWNVAVPGELEHADGVCSRLVERLIAGHRRDAQDLHLG